MRRLISAAIILLLGSGVFAVVLPSASSAFAQSAAAPADATTAGQTLWVTTTQRIKSRLYEHPGLSAHPILVIVVHGDLSDPPPRYQYRFAKLAAAAIPDAVVAAVLRPGYSDGEDTSDGMRGFATSDNYTPEIVNAVASVLSELKDRYHPRRVILVGHSGGAAIAGDLLGQQGVAADGALLVSCPCDLVEARKHLRVLQGNPIWDRPVRSLSPLALVDRVPASTKIWMLFGSDDQTTPSALALPYTDALRNRNVAVNVTIAPGLGHDILLEPVAMDQLKEVVGAIDTGK
jgi:predicted esterase